MIKGTTVVRVWKQWFIQQCEVFPGNDCTDGVLMITADSKLKYRLLHKTRSASPLCSQLLAFSASTLLFCFDFIICF